jgi:hypothetical protein
MPDGHSGPTVTLKVSLQPHPMRQAIVLATWYSAVNGTESTVDESIVSEVEVCRWIEASDGPLCDM